jgi:hypothetical protein
MDAQMASDAIQEGKMQQTMETVLSSIKPEAAYFTALNGKRTALIVFDLKDPSIIPQIAEPLFSVLGAEVEFCPVMNRDELTKGLQSVPGVRKAA